MRRAKIICTLGPASSTPEDVHALVDAGMDVARLNMSHGTWEQHEESYYQVRAASESTGRGVGIFIDLQGPKIRLGRFASGAVTLDFGERFVITTQDVPGDERIVSTTYEGLPGDVSPGDTILIDDGRLVLEVLEKNDTDVVTRVLVGGACSNNKGLNLPGVKVSLPALSDKDAEDLRWALRLGVDMVALSFVRTAEDVDDVHRVMDEVGRRVPVIAKFEKPQAMDHLDEIVESFDSLMVARGDMGVEVPLERVPLMQKQIVEAARRNAKPAIVATQMLESMVQAPRPTRAEASDVANAVLDGADALMLSAETSVGRYPVEAVATMAQIIEAIEEQGLQRMRAVDWEPRTRSGIITKAATEVAERVGAQYLVSFTQSGDTARRMSRYRSRIPMLAFTPVAEVRAQLALSWGVETFFVPPVSHTDQMVKQVDRTLVEIGRGKEGDLVVIVAGSPPGIQGSTNALRVHRIGDAVNELVPAYEDDL